MQTLHQALDQKYAFCFSKLICRDDDVLKLFGNQIRTRHGEHNMYRLYANLVDHLVAVTQGTENELRWVIPLLHPDICDVRDPVEGDSKDKGICIPYPKDVITDFLGDEPTDDAFDSEAYRGRPVRVFLLCVRKALSDEKQECVLYYGKVTLRVDALFWFFNPFVNDQGESVQPFTSKQRKASFSTWKFNAKTTGQNPDNYVLLSLTGLLNHIGKRRQAIQIDLHKKLRLNIGYDPTCVPVEERLWTRYESIAPNTRMFHWKEEALNYARRSGLAAFGWDKNNRDAKIYLVCSYADMITLRWFPDKLTRLVREGVGPKTRKLWLEEGGFSYMNEFILSERECKPYVDMEYELEGNEHLFSAEASWNITLKVIRLMIDTLECVAPYAGFSPKDFVVLDASRENKISKHLIYDGDYFFPGTPDLVHFVQVMKARVSFGVLNHDPDILEIMVHTKKKQVQYNSPLMSLAEMAEIHGNTCECVIDWGVYSNNDRSLRMAYGGKKKYCEFGGYPLRFESSDQTKTLADLEAKYPDGMLYWHTPKDEQRVLLSTLIQFVPPEFVTHEERVITLSSKDMRSVIRRWQKELVDQAKSDPRTSVLLAQRMNALAPGKRRRKRIRQELELENGVRVSRICTPSNGVTRKEMVRIRDEPFRACLKAWINRTIPQWHPCERFLVKARFFVQQDRRKILDAVVVYPATTKYCPIKASGPVKNGMHRSVGKTGVALLPNGNYFFECSSSNCKGVVSAQRESGRETLQKGRKGDNPLEGIDVFALARGVAKKQENLVK